MKHLASIALFTFLLSASQIAAQQTGELVLRAVDIDTGKPIPEVAFAIENGDAEDWAHEVGRAGKDGTLQFQTHHRPGYYYMVLSAPKEYDVAGLDDVYVKVIPGGTITHTFKLRKTHSKKKLPPILPASEDHQRRVPPPRPQKQNVNLASSVDNMPGFEGKRVIFWFYPNKQWEVSAKQLAHAEQIYLNGERVAAAVRDELEYFQKAVPEDHGEIDQMYDILIEVGETDGRFWCRLPKGLPLRQHGYRIGFRELDDWNLTVPFYLQ